MTRGTVLLCAAVLAAGAGQVEAAIKLEAVLDEVWYSDQWYTGERFAEAGGAVSMVIPEYDTLTSLPYLWPQFDGTLIVDEGVWELHNLLADEHEIRTPGGSGFYLSWPDQVGGRFSLFRHSLNTYWAVQGSVTSIQENHHSPEPASVAVWLLLSITIPLVAVGRWRRYAGRYSVSTPT